MPDLFDNFFGKMSTTLNGGRTKPHYSGSNRVNSGSFYSYHENSTNNNYWMPTGNKDFNKTAAKIETVDGPKPRMGSVTSMNSEGERSRNSSVSD